MTHTDGDNYYVNNLLKQLKGVIDKLEYGKY